MKRDMQNMMRALNQAMADTFKTSGKSKGTSYWYTKGVVGNKRAQYTRAKTYYNGRFGFWSWVATKYKNGMTKRNRFALSRTKAKAEDRAERLFAQLEKKEEE